MILCLTNQVRLGLLEVFVNLTAQLIAIEQENDADFHVFRTALESRHGPFKEIVKYNLRLFARLDKNGASPLLFSLHGSENRLAVH